jgi:prepilin-type N-terminal cleavage/methylation domain-containing protein
VISFTPWPCLALSDFSRLEAKQGHATSAKRDRFSASSFLKFRIPHFAFPNKILPFPASATRTLALALHQPISSGNPKFNIQNPHVSASRNRGAHFAFPNQIPPLRPLRPLREQSAFTLVELLAVIGIMGLLAAVGVPALKGLTGSGGRKQALSQLMGAIEIARNTAISTGTNAAVIFPDLNFASKPYRYRSMAVISWDTTNSTNGGPGTNPNVMLGSWITLPQGIVLHDKQINRLPTVTNKTSLQIPPITNNTIVSNLRAIVFQPDGGLDESYYTNTLTSEGIAFYEGAVVSDTTTINSSKQKTNVETITITRYTGRTIPTLAKPK